MTLRDDNVQEYQDLCLEWWKSKKKYRKGLNFTNFLWKMGLIFALFSCFFQQKLIYAPPPGGLRPEYSPLCPSLALGSLGCIWVCTVFASEVFCCCLLKGQFGILLKLSQLLCVVRILVAVFWALMILKCWWFITTSMRTTHSSCDSLRQNTKLAQ